VDLISIVPPFAYDPGLRPGGRTLFTQKDALGMTQMSFWTARTDFLAQNRAALVDFMADALRALHWYTDPANRAEMIAIVARASKLPPERFADWVFSNKDYYRDPNGLPDLEALQHNMETQRALGLLSATIDVKSHADLSIVAAAAKTLD
jgi:sulfonate transport system substrate-binding protein